MHSAETSHPNNRLSIATRIIVFCVGVPMVILGTGCSIVTIGRILNPPAPPVHPLHIQVMSLMVTGVFALAGGWCWKFAYFGPQKIRNAGRDASKELPRKSVEGTSPIPTHSGQKGPTTEAAPRSTYGQPLQTSTLMSPTVGSSNPSKKPLRMGTGELIATCGSEMTGQLHYYFVGVFMIVLGIAAFTAFDKILTPKPGDEKTIKAAGIAIGGLLSLCGAGMVLSTALTSSSKITLFDNRMEVEQRGQTQSIPLDQILRMRLQEWYEHRFAPQTFKVTVFTQQGDVKFSTAQTGDPTRIVEFLCSIIDDVEVRQMMG